MIVIGDHVVVIDNSNGSNSIDGIYAGEDYEKYHIVISPGGLTQLLKFSKSDWNLRKIGGWTEIQWFLDTYC